MPRSRLGLSALPLTLLLAACTSTGGAAPTASATLAPPASSAPASAAPSPSSSVESPSASASTSPSAASGGSAGEYGDYGGSSSSSASTPPSASTAAASLTTATSKLGKIIVDGAGRTLYAFTPDVGGKPTCYAQCAANWPALMAGGKTQVAGGLDDGDVAAVARTDGGQQVTFYGLPLYYFAGDAAPGDTNGQGLAGKWFVVSPDGKLVK